MRGSKLKKSLVKIGISTLVANQLMLYPFLASINNVYEPRVFVTSSLAHEYKDLNPSFSAQDYLFLSASIVDNKSIGSGDCKDYTLAMYDTYNELIKINERPDLENRVRFVSGVDSGIGHTWLEYIHQGTYHSFESTMPTPLLDPKEVRLYALKNEDTYKLDEAQVDTRFLHSLAGSRKSVPEVAGILYPGGTMRVIMIAHGYSKHK